MMFLIIIFCGISFSSLWVRVKISLRILIKIFEFIILFELFLLWSWEDSEELGDLFLFKSTFFGELNIELDVEISVTHLIFPEWHTLTLDASDILVRDDFIGGGGNGEFFSIEMGDFEVESCEGLKESDFFIEEEICTFSAESFVFFDHDSDMEITGKNSWGFI